MFLARPIGRSAQEVASDADLDGTVWLDLINPTESEIKHAERICGYELPTREELDEIESSSRHYSEAGVVYLSTPLVRRTHDDYETFPIGIMVTEDRLVTVRYSDYRTFDRMAREIAEGRAQLGSRDILVLLLEAAVDRLADVLEMLGRSMDTLSRRIFREKHPKSRARANQMLRDMLQRVGLDADLASKVRDSLLGLDRIGIYLSETERDRLSEAQGARLRAVGRDISSLTDFANQALGKAQFLQDAILGFINIEQNDGMKVLTVVSFIGVMPTLIAGIYGMNFKDIPELNWAWGYWYSLALMAVSVIIPLTIFWWRGWFGQRRL